MVKYKINIKQRDIYLHKLVTVLKIEDVLRKSDVLNYYITV